MIEHSWASAHAKGLYSIQSCGPLPQFLKILKKKNTKIHNEYITWHKSLDVWMTLIKSTSELGISFAFLYNFLRLLYYSKIVVS
jgi:hypothetical protein